MRVSVRARTRAGAMRRKKFVNCSEAFEGISRMAALVTRW
jgi:hypothetical protein